MLKTDKIWKFMLITIKQTVPKDIPEHGKSTSFCGFSNNSGDRI